MKLRNLRNLIASLLVFCLFAAHASAAVTLVKRETFVASDLTAVGQLDSTHVGQFGSVAGTLGRRSVGIVYAGNTVPWGAVIDGTTSNKGVWDPNALGITPGGVGYVKACCWVRIKAFTPPTGAGNSYSNILAIGKASLNTQFSSLAVQSDGALLVNNAASGITLQTDTWYYFEILDFSWDNWDHKLKYFMRAGTSGTYTQIGTEVNSPNWTGAADTVTVGSDKNLFKGDNRWWCGVIAGASIYSADAAGYATPAYPADLPVPDDTKTTWLVATNGSATADGRTNALSLDRASNDMYCGAILGRSGLGNGDVVSFASGSYDVGTQPVLVAANGVTITGSPMFSGFKPLTTWTQPDAGGAPNVWQASGTTGNPRIFENGTPLRAQYGANLAAVKSALNTTAGSFWCDGAGNAYVHASDNGNPNSNGSAYTFTRVYTAPTISNNSGLVPDHACLVAVLAKDVTIASTVSASGACQVSPSAIATLLDGTVLCTGVGFGSSCSIGGAYTYGGKHVFEVTTSVTSGTFTYSATANYCEPTDGTNGGTAFVIYGENASGTGTATFRGATCTANWLQEGSAGGQVGGDSWLTHNKNDGNNSQYATITLAGCNLSGGSLAQNNITAGALAVDSQTSYVTFYTYGGGQVSQRAGGSAGGSGTHSWLGW